MITLIYERCPDEVKKWLDQRYPVEFNTSKYSPSVVADIEASYHKRKPKPV